MSRKKNFDPEQVLARAVELFWKKGYADTSLSDLVEYLGINRFSLYSTFGDKKSLYLLSLNYYIDNHSVPALEKLNATDSGLKELESYFSYFSKIQYSQTSGCFVQNAILELSLTDQDVSQAGQRLYSLVLAGFTNVLKNAQQANEISTFKDVDKISHFLLLQVQGIRVLGKSKQYTAMEDAVLIISEFLQDLRVGD
ncbi:MAG: TetR/AcrR family transcriptional repressor of nem operon [Oceanospirillaceae bacterium]|jgi:TetR/AcrR family transcriptional repressor of nem operon